jgi:NAD(P)-dependent dehydrogenase (short-subunit alcohol dehydrogenase family)
VAIAGGAGGIGTATALRLAAEGANVVVGDLNDRAAARVADQIIAAGAQGVATTLDVGDEPSVTAFLELAVDRFGGLDGLVANAAAFDPDVIMRDTDAVDVPLDVVDRTLAVNLRGYFLCVRHAIPLLLARGGGAIVCTSSAAAFLGERERPAYAMSKSGVNALVRHVASRWGRDRIRANAVAPGLVLTPAARSGLTPEFEAEVIAATRSHRLGEPEDVAALIAFLASDDGEWITGQVISVDGGWLLR